MKKMTCDLCGDHLQKHCIALNKKLLGRNISKFLCFNCLAEFFGCTHEDLLVKIEEFKEQGCTLFK